MWSSTDRDLGTIAERELLADLEKGSCLGRSYCAHHSLAAICMQCVQCNCVFMQQTQLMLCRWDNQVCMGLCACAVAGACNATLLAWLKKQPAL